MKNAVIKSLIIWLSRFLDEEEPTYKYKYRGISPQAYVSEVDFPLEHMLRLVRKGKTETLFGHGSLRTMRMTLKK